MTSMASAMRGQLDDAAGPGSTVAIEPPKDGRSPWRAGGDCASGSLDGFCALIPYNFVPLVVLVVKKSCVMFSAAAVLIVARGASAADPPPFERTETREPCANYAPLRNPYFGDL